MPKKTRRYNHIVKKTRKRIKIKKMVSFSTKTSLGEPVIDHSYEHSKLFDSMTEIHL